jgi:hypothetical protein
MNSHRVNFQLIKWFLDFTTDDGNAMIFYAAEMRWHRWTSKYTSWLNHSPNTGSQFRSRFTSVKMPRLNGNEITWNDSKFGVSGTWNSTVKPINARLFESDSGFLDWNCFQPKSDVRLVIGNEVKEGRGYAEQLILTALPWKIPMNELRWGRYVSDKNYVVWIELREKDRQQWMWMNGDNLEKCMIEDDRIEAPQQEFTLSLDRAFVLESEKKISSVTGKLIRYVPGFNKIMPVKFLMADETKWLSHGRLQINNQKPDYGMTIHERVNFNSEKL